MNTSLWSETAPPRLLASCHRQTGALVFPPLPAHSPLSPEYEPAQLAAEGIVYSFTVIHPAPKSGLPPFALGYLDLDGPARLFGRINGTRRPQIGDRCRIVPDDTYGYSFELMEAGQ
ncbi:Zn-ribbon domain-containing OB-fold protein [Pseudomonas sp. X10]